MTEQIDEQIAKLNQRSKAAKLQVSVERRNNWLWTRGTFPPKPHLKTHREPYRQRFSLDLPANQLGLQ